MRSAWLGQFLGRQRLTQPHAHRCSHNCWARVHHRFTDHAIITAAHAIARTTANFQCIAAHATTELLHTQSQTLALATGTARTMLLFNGRQSHACDTTATIYATYIHLSSRIMGGMLSRSGKLRRLTWARGPRPTAKFKIGREQPSFSHCSCLASSTSSSFKVTALQIRKISAWLRPARAWACTWFQRHHSKFGESHKSHSELHSNSWPCSRTHKSISSCQRS